MTQRQTGFFQALSHKWFVQKRAYAEAQNDAHARWVPQATIHR